MIETPWATARLKYGGSGPGVVLATMPVNRGIGRPAPYSDYHLCNERRDLRTADPIRQAKDERAMTALSYREYATDLHNRIRQLRVTEDVSASIEVAICRNAYCYKSEEVTGYNGSARYSTGPLNSAAGLIERDSTETMNEIEAFFSLPEIYAYSDFALANGNSPLERSHWDGTVALIEVSYETAVTKWHQRMLFIGFSDPIHADFTVGLDRDLFIHEHNTGKHFFEWRSTKVPAAVLEIAAVGRKDNDQVAVPEASSVRQRLSRFANVKWLGPSASRRNTMLTMPEVRTGYSQTPTA